MVELGEGIGDIGWCVDVFVFVCGGNGLVVLFVVFIFM